MQKKVIITGLSMVMAAGICQAQVTPNLDEGTKEIAGFGSFASDTPGGDVMTLDLGYGWFVRDQLQLGVVGGFADDDAGTVWDIGGAVEYNFMPEGWGAWVPYVGAGILGIFVDPDDFSSDETGAVSLSGGMKYFIHDNVALGLSADWNYAFDEVFVDEGGSTSDNRFVGLFTIRVYID